MDIQEYKYRIAEANARKEEAKYASKVLEKKKNSFVNKRITNKAILKSEKRQTIRLNPGKFTLDYGGEIKK